MKHGIRIIIAGLVVGMMYVPAVPAATIHDVAADFSLAANPNGVWSYGYTTTLGGALILYTDKGTSSGLEYWFKNLYLGAPGVAYNPTDTTLDVGTPQYGPGQVGFHPGPNGQNAIIRFTVPVSGTYHLESSFVGIDERGTTTDVHVLVNAVSIFDGIVQGFGPGTGPSFVTDLTLAEGDRVDFAVGYRIGGFFYDSTGIAARLVYDPCGDSLHPYPAGDMTRDCWVNLPDFAELAAQWESGSCDAGTGWCNGADLSRNGVVDLEDLAVLAGAWLDCTDPNPPCSFVP